MLSYQYLYILTFPDGRKYIGHTGNPKSRLTIHKYKFKEKATMEILCIGSKDYISNLEPKAIITFQTNDPTIGRNELIGRNLSEITRRKISKATMGRTPWNKGAKRTLEERAAIKAGLDKSEKTTGARKKLAALNKQRAGQPLSPEHREAVRASLKGRTIHWRHKIAEAMRGNHNRHPK